MSNEPINKHVTIYWLEEFAKRGYKTTIKFQDENFTWIVELFRENNSCFIGSSQVGLCEAIKATAGLVYP